MARTLILGQRRIEIGHALQTCMIQKGSYESTSVKDIARQAGLTTSLVHYYFNSKDKILFFIADIALHEVSNQLDELLHLKNNEDRIVLLRETLFDQEQNKFRLSCITHSVGRFVQQAKHPWQPAYFPSAQINSLHFDCNSFSYPTSKSCMITFI